MQKRPFGTVMQLNTWLCMQVQTGALKDISDTVGSGGGGIRAQETGLGPCGARLLKASTILDMAKAVMRSFPELEAPAVPGTAVTFKGFASSWRSAIGCKALKTL